MIALSRRLWTEEKGQDIAEYEGQLFLCLWWAPSDSSARTPTTPSLQWRVPSNRERGGRHSCGSGRDCFPFAYCSIAYSALACFRMGMSGSASKGSRPKLPSGRPCGPPRMVEYRSCRRHGSHGSSPSERTGCGCSLT